MATPTTGNDSLSSTIFGDTLLGLDGNDTLDGGFGVNFDGGPGNDLIKVGGWGVTVTGGAGQDKIQLNFPYYLGSGLADAIVVADFAAGGGGDTLDFSTLLTSNGADTSNPVGAGYIQLRQVGADTIIDWDADGGANAFVPLVKLVNIALADLTSFNLGFDPTGKAITGTAVSGGGGNETLSGTGGNDTILGFGGDDSLSGLDGSDSLDGGIGNDVLSGGAGDDTLLGNDGNDSLDGNGGNDSLDGGAGNDTLTESSGANILVGGDGNDVINVFGGSATVSGGLGADIISLAFSASSDRILVDGGDGNDTIEALGQGPLGSATLGGGAGADSIHAGDVGLYVLQGGAGNDTLIGDAGADTLLGEADDDSLDGGAGADSLAGGAGADTLLGGFGNDTLSAGPGNDVIDGGAGVDLLVVDLPYHLAGLSFTASLGNAGYMSSTGVTYNGLTLSGTLTAGGETDSFSHIEAIQFADGRLVFDPADPIGQVSRMYLAALGRAPDTGGLNAWSSYVEAGHSISDLAQAFIGSAEFQARYPAVSNSGFVTLLYENTLGREPDAGGLSAWTGYMDSGFTKVQMLTAFSESTEHYNRTAGLWTNGVWDMDETGAEVARLYYAALGRAPDAGGWQAWTNYVKAGHSASDLAAAFPASAEFQARYPNVDNAGYVKLLYENTLGREPDQGGYDAWLGYMNAGHSRVELLQFFADSQEFINKTLPLIDGGITFA